MPRKKENNKPRRGDHKFQWDLRDVPLGVKSVVLSFLLAHKALYNKKFALHKLEHFKEHGFVAKKDVFYDGGTIIRRTFEEEAQKKIHDAKYVIKIDFLKAAVRERQAHSDSKFKEAQDALTEYFTEAQTMHGKWAQGGFLAPYDYSTQRACVVQCITKATSDIVCSHTHRKKKWDENQTRKNCEAEIKINKQTILREALDEDAEREKDLADQVSDLRLLLQHMRLPRDHSKAKKRKGGSSNRSSRHNSSNGRSSRSSRSSSSRSSRSSRTPRSSRFSNSSTSTRSCRSSRSSNLRVGFQNPTRPKRGRKRSHSENNTAPRARRPRSH